MNRGSYILLTFLLGLNTSAAFGQNGLVDNRYFILQTDNNEISINSFEDHQINELRTYEINGQSVYTTDGNEQLAILDTALNTLSIINFKTQAVTNQKIPFSLNFKTLLLTEDNVFIGGENKQEILIQFHLDTQKWYTPKIPAEVMHPGKAIDDFLVNDSMLLAIDNIVLPKYILYYKMNGVTKIEYSHFRELKSNGTYESIHQGRITPNYIGLISSTYSGYTGRANHITIYNKNDMNRSFSISVGEQNRHYHTFNDFLIVNDKIIIASKERGLGRMNIKSRYFKNLNKDFNSVINASKIKYRDFKNDQIIKLTVVPHSNFVIVTTEGPKGELRHRIIEV